jgi:diaminopimelate decarboxylase
MAGGNSKISTGHIDSKFGISIHQMPHLLRIIETTGLKVEGLHMHTGSDILDSEIYLLMANILFEASLKFKDLEYLDFGSGFKVAYKEGDVETDVAELGSKLSDHFNKFCREYGRELRLVFEPGKYLVSESGYFLASVNVVKQTISTVFAGVDTGMNHFIRPMFYNAHHEVINISNPDDPSRPKSKKRIYTVVGYICETDTLGVNRQLTEVGEGDVLCFLNAGAYCYSMSSNYNSRYRPAEVLIYEGKAYLIRRREIMEDLLRNQIEIPAFA